jgi:hypothetical protein
LAFNSFSFKHKESALRQNSSEFDSYNDDDGYDESDESSEHDKSDDKNHHKTKQKASRKNSSHHSPSLRSGNQNSQNRHSQNQNLQNQNSQSRQADFRGIESIRSETEEVIDLGQLRNKYADLKLGRRSTPRYAVSIEVLLMCSKRSMRTKTVNISETGALLLDLIPSELAKETFEVLFTAINEQGRKEFFLFHAKAVDAPLRTKRIYFIKSLGQSSVRLHDLIENLTPLRV